MVGGIQPDPPLPVANLHPGVAGALAQHHPADVAAGDALHPQKRQQHVGHVLAHALPQVRGLLGGGGHAGDAGGIGEGIRHDLHAAQGVGDGRVIGPADALRQAGQGFPGPGQRRGVAEAAQQVGRGRGLPRDKARERVPADRHGEAADDPLGQAVQA